MASRDELYAKFGMTAEAAQLFELELGTLLLCVRGLEAGWHVLPDGATATEVLRVLIVAHSAVFLPSSNGMLRSMKSLQTN